MTRSSEVLTHGLQLLSSPNSLPKDSLFQSQQIFPKLTDLQLKLLLKSSKHNQPSPPKEVLLPLLLASNKPQHHRESPLLNLLNLLKVLLPSLQSQLSLLLLNPLDQLLLHPNLPLLLEPALPSLNLQPDLQLLLSLPL